MSKADTWLFVDTCVDCDYPIVVTQATKEFCDYWFYCSNKNCINHADGEQVGDMEYPTFCKKGREIAIAESAYLVETLTKTPEPVEPRKSKFKYEMLDRGGSGEWEEVSYDKYLEVAESLEICERLREDEIVTTNGLTVVREMRLVMNRFELRKTEV